LREVKSSFGPTPIPASSVDFEAVRRLLSDNLLPVADLEAHLDAFMLAKIDGALVGSVGLEIHGELALLRSLCVAESHRSRGIGFALVSAIAARAAARGVRELYLLTTGAAPYFAAQGFIPVSREHAPRDILNTAQFRSLCPSSAVLMRRSIAAAPANSR
jgi:N-acetylglutamate synthase-like GNAT family acetyltransferase